MVVEQFYARAVKLAQGRSRRRKSAAFESSKLAGLPVAVRSVQLGVCASLVGSEAGVVQTRPVVVVHHLEQFAERVVTAGNVGCPEELMNDSRNQVGEATSAAQKPWLKVQGSRYFIEWLAEQGISLAFTTYQTGKLFFVGRKPDSSISMFERTYNHCMGMWAAPDAKTIWLSSRYQIWRMTQAPANAVPRRPVEPDNPASTLPPWTQRDSVVERRRNDECRAASGDSRPIQDGTRSLLEAWYACHDGHNDGNSRRRSRKGRLSGGGRRNSRASSRHREFARWLAQERIGLRRTKTLC